MLKVRCPQMASRFVLAAFLLMGSATWLLSATARAGETFDASGVELLSYLPLSSFPDNQTQGNDCWGYTSPSGRRYAIIGFRKGTAFVEITDPYNATLVDYVDGGGVDTVWRDMKTHGQYCYIVTDGSGVGLQVADMGNIDDGTVTVVNTVTDFGFSTAHNFALNEDSGFAYLAGSGLGGLVAVDLSDPINPEFVGVWNGHYLHDVLVVSYTEGPYAGREIAFGFGTGGGMYIVDVTDKNDMFTRSVVDYGTVAICHQGWVSEDQRYVFIGDEGDESSFGLTTTTYVYDVQDLDAPEFVTSFTNGNTAIDHNMMVRGNYLYEANYTSGLRIFDISDVTDPVEVGYFDTFPGGDGLGFAGAWAPFTGFPGSIVIVSDYTRGLFVLDAWQAIGAGRPVGACCTPPEAPQGEGCTDLTEDECLAITDGEGNNAVWQGGHACGEIGQECVRWECQIATGPCEKPHGGLGCSLASCCEFVCSMPEGEFCCEVGWDQACVDLATGPTGCDPAPERPAPDSTTGIATAAMSCTNDADCRFGDPNTQATCIPDADSAFPGVCYVARNRFISIMPNPENAGVDTARRISLQTKSGNVALGWMGQPVETPVVGPEPSPQYSAQIVPTPVYLDWSEFGPVVHLGDCEVSTGQTYHVQSISAGSDIAIEINYSESLVLPTVTLWGDVSGLDNVPNNVRNLEDVFQVVLGFQGEQTLPISWLELEGMGKAQNVPNFQTINLADVFRDVQAFQGSSYPFSLPCECSNPSPCP